MTNTSIYKDKAVRTDGSIFLGVVGPVRTGKSTFIKRFMDQLVLPNIEGEFQRERANDELPQASSGRTIMTTEPKFIPENAAKINLDGGMECNVRLIDCVGYIVPSSLGYIEGDSPRMVKTPWYEEEIPFNMAAEIGTKKVITEHSTIGLVITTDGSISDIPREEYAEAEQRVINELKEINKPFVVLLNCIYPTSDSAENLASELSEKYSVPVIPVNCLELSEEDIHNILARVLFEFPIKQVTIDLPDWVSSLNEGHSLRSTLYNMVIEGAENLTHIRDIKKLEKCIANCEQIDSCILKKIDLGSGKAELKAEVRREIFFDIVSENSGVTIKNDCELINCLAELSKIKMNFCLLKTPLKK